MAFPESNKVIYQKNPIDSVICQLRFPAILKIDTEVPSSFQSEVIEKFPEYSVTIDKIITQADQQASGLPREVISQLNSSSTIQNHAFSTLDGVTRINLTRNFISLSTRKYTKWRDYFSDLEIPIRALLNIYKPAKFTRIGLRYIDVIKRSDLGIKDMEWSQLINAPLLGILADSQLSYLQKSFKSESEVEIDNGFVRVVTGLVVDVDTGEQCFKIDSDFYTSNVTETNEYLDILKGFNEEAGNLIRWSITPDLHSAMGPCNYE